MTILNQPTRVYLNLIVRTDKMIKGFAHTPQGQIFYQTEGLGEPLLLLHASPMDSDEYLEVMPMWGKHYRVIAIDTPGFGRSDEIPHEYVLKDYALAVIEFLKEMEIEKASIVGHLTGSLIALEVAVRHPRLVDKLVLVSCPYYDQKERETRTKELNNFICARYEIRPDGSHIMEKWERRRRESPGVSPKNWHKAVIMDLLAGTRANMPKVLLSYDMERRMPLIKNPTLLIYGTSDRFYRRMETVQSLIPHSQTKVVEGANDFILMENSKKPAEAILEFLKQDEVMDEVMVLPSA